MGHSAHVSVAARARLQNDERRAQLLALGLRLFGERSYDEISIDDIAREAGVSKGLLYHYFGGKRAFYVACVAHAAEGLVAKLASVVGPPGEDRARAGLAAYLDFVEEHRVAYRTLMFGGLGNDPEVVAILERARGAIHGRMLSELGIDATERPVFRAAAVGWIGQVEASCLDWLVQGTPSRDELVALLLGSLFGVLASAKLVDPDADVELPPSPFAG